jgi:hypothetical protein
MAWVIIACWVWTFVNIWASWQNWQGARDNMESARINARNATHNANAAMQNAQVATYNAAISKGLNTVKKLDANTTLATSNRTNMPKA